MAIIHPMKPGDSGEEGASEAPGSSVLRKTETIRGKRGKYIVALPEGSKGEEIEHYLKGGSKEGIEIDDIFKAARENREKGFNADTKEGLNFTIVCTDRYKNRYQIVLRRARGFYRA